MLQQVIIYTSRGAVRINDASTSGHGTFSQNDIVGCALDIDNNKVYFHKNGTYIQSGDPAGNSGGQAIPADSFLDFLLEMIQLQTQELCK